MRNNTWIETASPERLIIRHRTGRAKSLMFYVFGGFAAVLAFVEPGNVRWAAGVLAIINFYVAWTKTSLVTIVFDRPAGMVKCGEQRPFLNREAALPLQEFLNAELKPAPRGSKKMQLGIATREGRFIPIDTNASPEASSDIAQTINDWLADRKVEGPSATPRDNSA